MKHWLRNGLITAGLLVAGIVAFTASAPPVCAQATSNPGTCVCSTECRMVLVWIDVPWPVGMRIPGYSYVCDTVCRCS